MKQILLITLRDFKAGVVTPKASAIAFFFIMFMGIFFSNFVDAFMTLQQKAQMSGGEAPTMNQLLKAMFYNLHFILLLVVPALTMSSFAEEKKSRTLKILLSAPVYSWKIVAAKYLSSMLTMSFVLVFTAVYPLFLMVYASPEVGVLFTSYLGVFLMISAQVSFGLWVSSLVSSQFMAFLFTMFGLFSLMVVDFLSPIMSGRGWFEGVFRYFASTKHLEVFLKGTLTVSSTTYFIVLTAGFLFLTLVTLDSERWR